MNEGASLTSSHTYFGEDDIIERLCFLHELCRDWLISGEDILRQQLINDKTVCLRENENRPSTNRREERWPLFRECINYKIRDSLTRSF